MEVTLKLPKNYVEIEEEEMMYLDGGFQVHNSIVSFTVNCIFNAITGGGTVSFIRKLIGSQGIKKNIIKATKKWLSAQADNRICGLVLGALSGFLSWSIGSFAAKIWDRADTILNNGYCGALW